MNRGVPLNPDPVSDCAVRRVPVSGQRQLARSIWITSPMSALAELILRAGSPPFDVYHRGILSGFPLLPFRRTCAGRLIPMITLPRSTRCGFIGDAFRCRPSRRHAPDRDLYPLVHDPVAGCVGVPCLSILCRATSSEAQAAGEPARQARFLHHPHAGLPGSATSVAASRISMPNDSAPPAGDRFRRAAGPDLRDPRFDLPAEILRSKFLNCLVMINHGVGGRGGGCLCAGVSAIRSAAILAIRGHCRSVARARAVRLQVGPHPGSAAARLLSSKETAGSSTTRSVDHSSLPPIDRTLQKWASPRRSRIGPSRSRQPQADRQEYESAHILTASTVAAARSPISRSSSPSRRQGRIRQCCLARLACGVALDCGGRVEASGWCAS